MPIGFGIIGCGMISRFHARAINDIPNAKLIGCVSSSVESAKKLASEFSIQAYPSIEGLLAAPDVDAVSVCTPSGAHLEPSIAAARAGKHVVVEKPLEIDLKRCDQIIDACAQHNVQLSTIFPSRFYASSQLLKAAIDNRKFGILTLGSAYVKWYRTQKYYDGGNWRGTWELDGGGALMNQAIHNVDLLTWLMGPVAEVSAQTATLAHQRIEVEDVATAVLRFENGALGTIEASTAAWPGWQKKIEIHGSRGSVRIEEEDVKMWQFETMTDKDNEIVSKISDLTLDKGGAADPAAIGHAGHTAQFKDIIQSIRNGNASAIDGHQGRRSVEIVQAIYKAAESGRLVELPLR